MIARFHALAGSSVVLALLLVAGAASQAQQRPPASAAAPAPGPRIVPCPTATGLLTVPEIKSKDGRLKAELMVTSGQRTMWDTGSARCATQYMRYFTGHSTSTAGRDDPMFASGEPVPGPTLRAKVGDWVEIAFFNHIDTQHFGASLDRGDLGLGNGCDVTLAGSGGGGGSKNQNNDTFPNCIHGSSTTNVHFHGTHTTPSTTGDNVLLFVRPVNRNNGAIQPSDKTVRASFAEFFTKCEKSGYPKLWNQMPASWQTAQRDAVDWYDANAPYQGKPKALPHHLQLAPVNRREIAQGLWPQYQIGATPYCFPLPAYNPARVAMGQSPGTHWYHAHKHGSTALNVANGMVGALIIEGAYDEELRKFYGSNPSWTGQFKDQVLVIQQLTPLLNLTNPVGGGPHTKAVPVLSVNGRRHPVITMLPNQVELFRFINGAERDAALFQGFVRQPSPAQPGPQPMCSRQTAAPCMHWNQTAQDGVQFVAANYDPGNTSGQGYQGKRQDEQFNLAPANRADVLMQAPATPGKYDLVVQAGLCRFPQNTGCAAGGSPPKFQPVPQMEVLLTVNVEGTAIAPAMPFVPVQSFPVFPTFLNDIPAADVHTRRELAFQDLKGLRINGKQFDDHHINQSMLLNSTEEWTISNLDNDKEHPFHIHINPFQIIEVFQPESPDAKPGGKCAADPTKPDTWRPYGPCAGPQSNFEWWDTFAIPASRIDTLPASTCTTKDQCPPAIRNRSELACASGTCTVTIPGHFIMRTRFVDFTGQYVLHCHILTHEDRGMMQLIEVVPDTTIYTHH